MNQEQTLTADWSAVDVNDEEESKPASGVESEWACDIWKALKERLLRNRKGKWCNFDDSETVPSMGFLEIKVKLDRGFFNLWWKQTHEEEEEEEEAIICIALSIIINGYNWEFDCYFFSCIIFEDEHGARLFLEVGNPKRNFGKKIIIEKYETIPEMMMGQFEDGLCICSFLAELLLQTIAYYFFELLKEPTIMYIIINILAKYFL